MDYHFTKYIMVLGILMALLICILVIAIIQWLAPKAGIPGNITQILCIIVIVLTIFKILASLGFGI
jgi:hypothetical protein